MKRQFLALLIILTTGGFGTTLMATVLPGNPVYQCTECKELKKELVRLKGRVAKLEEQIKRSAEGQVAAIGDFLRYPVDNAMIDVPQTKASDECEQLRSRLPTIKELIEDAVKHNTKLSLLSVEDYNLNKIPTGFERKDFYLIHAKNADGKEEKFYYSNKKYERPSGDLGHAITWSSSFHPEDPLKAFVFLGSDGDVGSDFFDSDFVKYSVRCIARGNR